jgi:hypothetical protein
LGVQTRDRDPRLPWCQPHPLGYGQVPAARAEGAGARSVSAARDEWQPTVGCAGRYDRPLCSTGWAFRYSTSRSGSSACRSEVLLLSSLPEPTSRRGEAA